MIQKLYKKLLDIYFQFKPHSTQDWERYWERRNNGRDWHGEQTNWIDGYWKSTDHPHRQLLVDTIAKYNPKTVLEIGCSCAPNLYLLAKRLPEAKIVGIDINTKAIQRGAYELHQRGVKNVSLNGMSAHWLSGLADGYFDVVFTDAMMIYIDPKSIRDLMVNIVRLTNKAVVFLERHSNDIGWTGKYINGLWYRDYHDLAKHWFPKWNYTAKKIPEDVWKEWSEDGWLVEISK